MKISRMGRFAAIAAAGAIALTACGSDNATGEAGTASSSAGPDVNGTLSGVGSSAQQAAMTQWQTDFQSQNSGANVQYSPDGSGAGRKAFLSGGANFAGSDAHLSDDEYSQAKDQCGPDGAIDIPVYVSPIAVAFNVKGVDSLNLDPATIAKIFKGEIKNWNDDAIKKQNQDADLPSTPITVVHRSDNSGTTENFTEYLSKAAEGAWGQEPSGDWPSQFKGEANKGTSGVISTTQSTDGAITYADESAVGDLSTAKVKDGDDYVEVSADSAAKAVEQSKKVEGRGQHDMSLELNRTPNDGSYPIVLVSYHVLCSGYSDQKTVDLVKAFENYVVSEDGQKSAASAAKSAVLPESMREDAKKAIESIKTK
ncbi:MULTISPECIES: phosphate ABC transporter substrate-binding protein PstS [Micrococcaceae]|uniref:phosphate ABC transporter substrate-binding protein PstS n=1 Tax=unclassified Kocuria TaxID=2649579 RepID=UPI001012F901|nr:MULTISPECIES: phosphate ABC transporter substrate-binding protein PstS [unclassified Kocuria]